MVTKLADTFCNLVQEGFENYYHLSGTCQFLITGNEATEFHITLTPNSTAENDLSYTFGTHDAPTATVEMPADYFQLILENIHSIDFGVPEFFIPIKATGDTFLATELSKAIQRPHPNLDAKFKEAEQLPGLSGLTEIERVERPSSALVAEKINQGVPIIVTDCLSRWNTTLPNLDALKSEFGKIPINASSALNSQTIADLISHMQNPPNPVGVYSKGIMLSETEQAQFPPPPFLKDIELSAPPQLWMGSASHDEPVTKLHRDGGTGFLGQVFGRKRIRMYSPNQTEYLYPCKNYTIFQQCWVELVVPNEELFPKYKHARPIDVTLHPGEMLIQPCGWYHSIYALDPVMSISYVAVDWMK